ncbi:MAG: hypothetical protein ACXABO_12940 [Promethearchaeota archaeon]|jgi:DNA repair exonuclease SbcCD ATPase subunit
MSLTDTKSSLKKIFSIIEELNGLNADSIPKLQAQPTNILEQIEKLEEDKAGDLRSIEVNDDEINSLKNKISQNQREITTLEESNDELTGERQVLLDKITATQNQLNETQENITSKKEELTNRTTRLEELEKRIAELTDIQEKFNNQMKELETQLEGDYGKKDKFMNSYGIHVAAMKSLIKAGYVQSPQLKVINSLVPQTSLEIKGLVSASGLREDVFKSILAKMVQENGPLEYDEASGTVTLQTEVDF